MPTYEYECLENGHRFEEFQSMTDEPLTSCPQCGGGVRRLIGTGAGIIFKGSGFYQTDYRSESYRKAEKAERSEAPDKKTSKPEKKSDPSKTESDERRKSSHHLRTYDINPLISKIEPQKDVQKSGKKKEIQGRK